MESYKKAILLTILLILLVPIAVGFTDTLNVLVTVSGEGIFAGSVRDLNNNLIANANVTVLGTIHSTVTATGNYNITGILDGLYTLIARADGYLNQTKTNQFAASGVTTTVDFSLGQLGLVKGNILDFFASSGINNANVTLRQFGADISSTLTDASGYYEFTSLAPGYYDVGISAAGYTTNSKSSNQVLGGQNTTVNIWLW